MNKSQFLASLGDLITRMRLEADLPLTVIGSTALALLKAGETPTRDAIAQSLRDIDQPDGLHVEISPQVIAAALEQLEEIGPAIID